MNNDAQLRVLIVRVGAMGDVLHGLPAVSALRTRRPDAYIGWAVDPRWAPLLTGDAGGVVDRVHPVPTTLWKKRPFSAETVQSLLLLRRELRGERYDICVDLQGTIRSAVIGRMSGAGQYLGPANPREPEAAWLYGTKVQTRAASVIRQACELLSEAVGERLVPGAVEIPCHHAADAWCTAHVGGPAGCLLVPGAGWGAKQWPAEHFSELGRALAASGERVLVNSAREDDPLARQVAEGCGAERVVCNVSEMISMVRTAKLVVGGDTGPVHLAAALGRPTVALFGPTDPERNGPNFPGARVRVLRHPDSVTSHKRVAETEAGLARISVAYVLEAAKPLLREGSHG